ncbi:unnamed protein product [Rotaria magnacalcarata]|uniref:Uncharacterized protein n=1 Tax=Rotaria magnacalcarata TaxID=392030 RepID=A0A8S2N398_9BILA|nr:unnamed protein product [Rotaria magnacalcarata]
MFIFAWFLIISSFVFSDKSSNYSSSFISNVPQSVRIPNSVYSLSQFIVNNKINVSIIPIEIIDPNLDVLSVRCLFDDASITPMYTFVIKISNRTTLFFECLLPDSIIRRLFYNRTIVSNNLVKYLYQPRGINFLSIHQDHLEVKSNDQMKKPIVLAQYPIIGHDKTLLNCVLGKFVIDTTIRERFSKRLVDEIDISSSSMLNYV